MIICISQKRIFEVVYYMISKKYIWVCLLLLLCICSGCAGVSDYEINLPGNLSINRLSANEVNISPYEGDNVWGTPIVPTKVTHVGWDNRYIVAIQQEISETDNMKYWIINIKTQETIGPYSKADYELRTKELLLDNIEIKKLEEYR